jgi:hypothetical protein
MLEKEEINQRCHRLRKLALFELDLNHAKCILVGRRLTHFLSDSGLLPSMQYELVHDKQRLSAVLKKVLCHDSLCLT